MTLTSRMRRITAAVAGATVLTLCAGTTPAIASSPLSNLVSAISTSEKQLQQLEGFIGSLQEAGNQALVDLRDAQFRSQQARDAADAAAELLAASTEALGDAQQQLDELSRSLYRTNGAGAGTTVGGTADDALDRNSYLRHQVEEQREIVEELDRQRSEQANREAELREAEELSKLREQEALAAEEEARTVIEQNAVELEEKTAKRDELVVERDTAASELTEQRGQEPEQVEPAPSVTPAEVPGADVAIEVAAAQSAHATLDNPFETESDPTPTTTGPTGETHGSSSGSSSDSEGAGVEPSADSSAAIETVIARAQSQIGVPYAWGGGDANGPTSGIRDGGIGDANGDYGKVGFDCSGLVLYAFAGVGIDLPHYTGYQFLRGAPVAHSDMQRGDLIFYGPGGGQHVAIYLGDGMMLEAPSSGGHVQETPVRWAGLSENAVRLI